jgi:hypothetical protein
MAERIKSKPGRADKEMKIWENSQQYTAKTSSISMSQPVLISRTHIILCHRRPVLTSRTHITCTSQTACSHQQNAYHLYVTGGQFSSAERTSLVTEHQIILLIFNLEALAQILARDEPISQSLRQNAGTVRLNRLQ